MGYVEPAAYIVGNGLQSHKGLWDCTWMATEIWEHCKDIAIP